MNNSVTLLQDIGICIIASAILALISNRLKQPILIAYLFAGLLIGPNFLSIISEKYTIDLISQLGLILLLFMVGMEMDVKKILQSGKPILLVGIIQVIICFLAGLYFFQYFNFPKLMYDTLYLSVCIALSSTMVVIKLLYEKFELDTKAGRLTLGILVIQDLWAILFLSFQPNLTSISLQVVLISLSKTILVVLVSMLTARYILKHLFSSVSGKPELIMLGALAWCFLWAGIGNTIGLSREMGALVAGISLSTFPYNVDVSARVVTLRDFFITLYFVGLGMKIPLPEISIVIYSVIAVVFLYAIRFISVVPVLNFSGMTRRISIITSLNISQISEFSLVIATTGFALGHITQDTLTILIFALSISGVFSVYTIQNNQLLGINIDRFFEKLGWSEKDKKHINDDLDDKKKYMIVLLGFYHNASSIVEELEHYSDFKNDDILVIDFNTDVIKKIREKGFHAAWGDIAHIDTLRKFRLETAGIIVCTVPDSVIKGTNNLKILEGLSRIAPDTAKIMTADSIDSAKELYEKGADYVIIPRMLSARIIVPLMEQILIGKGSASASSEIAELKRRREIIS